MCLKFSENQVTTVEWFEKKFNDR